MKQALLISPKKIEIQEVPDIKATSLKNNEILLNIKKIGICGSDIHTYHGQHPSAIYPLIQGHEYAGIVVAVGEKVSSVKPGMKATGRPQIVCGTCNPCKKGLYNICHHLKVEGFQANGVARDYFIIPEDRVVVVPDKINLDHAAMIEPLAVAAHATKRPRCLTGKNVVVSGAGTIGNLIAQFALIRGAKRVVITDVSDFRLETAQKCGIKDVINVSKNSLENQVHDIFGSEGYQVAFECAGVESSIRNIMTTIEKGSDIIIVGVHAKDPAINMEELGEHELYLIGSLMYLHEDYLEAVHELSSEKIKLEPLITNHFSFKDYNLAYQFIDQNKDRSMKVMIDL